MAVEVHEIFIHWGTLCVGALEVWTLERYIRFRVVGFIVIGQHFEHFMCPALGEFDPINPQAVSEILAVGNHVGWIVNKHG